MKKIKNLFNFPNLDSPLCDDDFDEMAVVVELTVGDILYFRELLQSRTEQSDNMITIKRAILYHDVLDAWNRDIQNAWPYRKKKAHEQFVANKKKRKKKAADERAMAQCENNAGYVGAVAHPINDEYNVECYQSKPAGIDVAGLPYVVVCSLHGTVHGTDSRADALKALADITAVCVKCGHIMEGTPEKTA